MNTLRWILAFLIAFLSWLFFPFCLGSVIANLFSYYPNPHTFDIPAAVLYFLTPVISFGMLILVLPSAPRTSLVVGIKIAAALFITGTLLFSALCLLFVGIGGFGVLFSELAGTAVGIKLAYAYLPQKSNGFRNSN